MKLKLAIITFTFFSSFLFQDNKDYKLYYDSGKLQLESRFDPNCSCSKVTEFYENGKVKATKTYIKYGNYSSSIDGEEIYYFENGLIQFYNFWKDGSPSGRTYWNYEDGKLAYEKYYSNKYKSGTWKFYNFDGKLREELVFEENKTRWDSNDDYALNKFYFNGELAYTINLVAGKKTNLVLIDKNGYDQLMALQPPLGQKLFIQNCSMCHSADVDIIGPKLKGVTERRSEEWLTKMITNGANLINNGDKEAVKLYYEWNQTEHPNFERLSIEEINAIIDYLRTMK